MTVACWENQICVIFSYGTFALEGFGVSLVQVKRADECCSVDEAKADHTLYNFRGNFECAKIGLELDLFILFGEITLISSH